MLKLLAVIEDMRFIILYDKRKELISSIPTMLVILISSYISTLTTTERQGISSSQMTLSSAST
jgi:hypothetical protein